MSLTITKHVMPRDPSRGIDRLCRWRRRKKSEKLPEHLSHENSKSAQPFWPSILNELVLVFLLVINQRLSRGAHEKIVKMMEKWWKRHKSRGRIRSVTWSGRGKLFASGKIDSWTFSGEKLHGNWPRFSRSLYSNSSIIVAQFSRCILRFFKNLLSAKTFSLFSLSLLVSFLLFSLLLTSDFTIAQ